MNDQVQIAEGSDPFSDSSDVLETSMPDLSGITTYDLLRAAEMGGGSAIAQALRLAASRLDEDPHNKVMLGGFASQIQTHDVSTTGHSTNDALTSK